MQRILMGAVAGVALGLVACVSAAIPAQQEWILFATLTGVILGCGRCNGNTAAGGHS